MIEGAHVAVLGGAGFIGSHLCERLLDDGNRVTAVDNLSTGSIMNVWRLDDRPGFRFVREDITKCIPLGPDVDYLVNLASPASPKHYMRLPIQTLEVGSIGTLKAATYCLTNNVRMLLASTSEVYGDPLVSPQPETYWGNVNPIGPRSVYDEAKRFAEATVAAFQRTYHLDARIVRIFNTYGPRMQRDDGRAVPAFMEAARKGEPLPVFGDGQQTRSLTYVDDLVDGMLTLLVSDVTTPVNIGYKHQMTMNALAQMVQKAWGVDVGVEYHPLPQDDPKLRQPDTSKAEDLLGWKAKWRPQDGLAATADWWRSASTS